MGEFTGDYYKCDDCNHIWDYMDDRCPECGHEDFEYLSAEDVYVESIHAQHWTDRERLHQILMDHDDLERVTIKYEELL